MFTGYILGTYISGGRRILRPAIPSSSLRYLWGIFPFRRVSRFQYMIPCYLLLSPQFRRLHPLRVLRTLGCKIPARPITALRAGPD